MMTLPIAGSKSLAETDLEWNAKPKESIPCSPIATVGQAKLNVLTTSDPSHALAYYRWTNLLRTTEKHWTDFELAEAFLELTERIGATNERLRMTPATEPGEPWLKEWRANRKRAGKRDAIMEELKARAQNRATLPHFGPTTSPHGSEPNTATEVMEPDPFADA